MCYRDDHQNKPISRLSDFVMSNLKNHVDLLLEEKIGNCHVVGKMAYIKQKPKYGLIEGANFANAFDT